MKRKQMSVRHLSLSKPALASELSSSLLSAAKQTINRMSVFWCSGQIRNPSTFVVTLPNLAQANANTHPILNYINLTYTKIEKEARGLIGIIKKSKVQPFDTHFNHH